jgi:FkbM family methyltransferase
MRAAPRKFPFLRRVKHALERKRDELGRELRIERYFRTSQHQIEHTLAALFPPGYEGFFVEAGAADGIAQSNTFWLERCRGWRGILVEALPDAAHRCRKVRPGSVVTQVALVPPNYPHKTVTFKYAGLMTVAEGARGSARADDEWVASGMEVQNLPATWTVEAPARTLTEVLATAGAPVRFDLLSLDVEGMEAAVLSGLDVASFAPSFVLVEMNDPAATDTVLRSLGYQVFDPSFTATDALYVREGTTRPVLR